MLFLCIIGFLFLLGIFVVGISAALIPTIFDIVIAVVLLKFLYRITRAYFKNKKQNDKTE